MCGYLAALGILWALFGGTLTVNLGELSHVALVPISAAIVMAAVVAVTSPPLAVVSAFVATASAALFSGSTLIPPGVAALSFILVAYSVAAARTVIATGRRRLNLDAEARKALTFVDEFENSGRGWFWETNAEGTLSYVSQQLADDFRCGPSELLGRQFTGLLSVDNHVDGVEEERKTLGFHLSARFPFSDVVVRAASDQDVHWSLSGNPVFDERGRFLGSPSSGAPNRRFPDSQSSIR
jgi:hypothetical protein